MKIFSYLFLLIIIVFGVSFALLNAEPVSINYYFNRATLPLSLLMLFSLIFGILIGFLVSIIMYLKQKRINYKLQKRIKLADAEIANLRSIPLKD